MLLIVLLACATTSTIPATSTPETTQETATDCETAGCTWNVQAEAMWCTQ